jgi:hypothetical protein
MRDKLARLKQGPPIHQSVHSGGRTAGIGGRESEGWVNRKIFVPQCRPKKIEKKNSLPFQHEVGQ